MKTNMDDLFQYHILLDKEDIERLFNEKYSISIDSHHDIPCAPFIHITLDKDARKEVNRHTALMVLKELSNNMYPNNDIFGNGTLVIDRDKFESIRKKFLDKEENDG